MWVFGGELLVKTKVNTKGVCLVRSEEQQGSRLRKSDRESCQKWAEG